MVFTYLNDQRPRERRKEKVREAILQAALDLVTERGPQALSLRKVAQRVDYSPAGLYEYFGSKEEIAVALVNEGFRRMSKYLKQIPEDLPAPEHVIRLGMAYLEFARSHKEHYLFMFNYATTLEG